MNHIKRFSELRRKKENFESFKKFCNESLIYLLDDNFSIFITSWLYNNDLPNQDRLGGRV